MDYLFSPSDEAFRKEVRAFVQREWDPHGYDIHGNTGASMSLDTDKPEALALTREFARKLGARGWYTMHWPKEYGGSDAPAGSQAVYREELAYHDAPVSVAGPLIAPLIMIHGQPWQKDYFLPRIGSGEIEFAQGFSEPNAGSDLANLQTRAVEDGDEYVVTGQKIWTSGAHWSEWAHVLVRTDPSAPRHRGISYLLMDMRSPGITLRRLYDFFGTQRWSEVFFDEVRVPKRNLLGEVNRGWYAAMTTLSFEYAGEVDGPARMLGHLDRFIAHCRETRTDGRRIIDDPHVRNSLADLRIDLETNRVLAYRVVWHESKGNVPGMEGRISSLLGSLNHQKFYPTLARLLGESAVLLRGSSRAPGGGVFASLAMLHGHHGFGGGGPQIGRNVIAQRGLGLPR